MTDGKPPGHPGHPYFKDVAKTLGEAYLRYEFTRGTAAEVEFLISVLELPEGARVLDVGCGPGRHAVALAQRGFSVTGVDVSPRFLAIAAERAARAGVAPSFFEVDARRMPFDEEFDAVLSICQGAFGLMGSDDGLILKRIGEACRPGGRVALTAFSALFEANNRRAEAVWDVGEGVVFEETIVKDPDGVEHDAQLWTGVYTPRELRLLAIGCGLWPDEVYSVAPGDYARRRPEIGRPEFLLLAHRP
jgi:SAM-dependent methyltransferase